MTDLLKCPICDKPLQPDDLCASDIEMGACHAECLEGSPVVDLDTGEETPDAKVDTFRAREIMEPGRQQRDKFESAVVKRLQESGFLEIEIRTECLARVGQGYQDEVINAGWHYWNEALWQNIPLVDPILGRSPDGLDFATPDEVFDKGPDAVREWQEARGRKPQITTPSPPPTGIALLQDGTLNLAFVANALAFYANHIEGRPQRGDYFPADLRLAAAMLVAETPPPQTHVVGTIAAFEAAYPEHYWHVAKGKVTAGEPLYGAIITDIIGRELGHGESNESAEAAFALAVTAAGLATTEGSTDDK